MQKWRIEVAMALTLCVVDVLKKVIIDRASEASSKFVITAFKTSINQSIPSIVLCAILSLCEKYRLLFPPVFCLKTPQLLRL